MVDSALVAAWIESNILLELDARRSTNRTKR